ncbi:hypothetical protein [Leptospira interrogans]|nr:hypothetical protein [Leptospira interrogans]
MKLIVKIQDEKYKTNVQILTGILVVLEVGTLFEVNDFEFHS